MTTFTFETVDGSGAGQSCLALDKEGNPHVAYATHLQPATLPNVMYAHRNAGTWALERLPTGANVERSDENRVCLAIDSQGNPQVAYIDDSSNHLIWAVKQGASWTFTHVPTRFLSDPQSVDAISFQLEGGSDPAFRDTPHFAYHDAEEQVLGHTTIVDGELQATVVDRIGIGVRASGFDTGLHPSLAWDPHASPMLAYFFIDDTGNRMALHMATMLNGTWQFGVLVPGGRIMGASVAVASGIEAVAYYDVVNRALKIWTSDGGDRTVAAGILNGRLLASAAVNAFQQLRVAYEDESKLKLASRDKFGEWTVEIVDPVGGFMPSLAYDNLGNAHIAYTAGNTLKYAKGTEGTS